MPTIGSLFAGIGGFEVAFEAAGWITRWQVEVDTHCVSVLARHWPTVMRYGDITNVRTEDLEPVDVICGGFPCQDLSVAGKRAGLRGSRSGLFFEFVRVARALAPRWLLIENVPGLLGSAGGRDMATVLGALEELGYGWAYRTLDARYFGVAQRRRRVFIVAGLGDWAGPAAVLFESTGRCRNTPSSGAEEAEPAPSPAGRAGGCRQGVLADTGLVVAETAAPIVSSYARTPDIGDGSGTSARLVAHAISASSSNARYDPNGETYVIHSVAVSLRGREGGATAEEGGEVSPTIRSSQGGGDKPYVRTSMVVRRLTPRECERLQAFPDDWTAFGADGRPIADGPRYRMLGNAVCTSVAYWIARRMLAVHEGRNPDAERIDIAAYIRSLNARSPDKH